MAIKCDALQERVARGVTELIDYYRRDQIMSSIANGRRAYYTRPYQKRGMVVRNLTIPFSTITADGAKCSVVASAPLVRSEL